MLINSRNSDSKTQRPLLIRYMEDTNEYTQAGTPHYIEKITLIIISKFAIVHRNWLSGYTLTMQCSYCSIGPHDVGLLPLIVHPHRVIRSATLRTFPALFPLFFCTSALLLLLLFARRSLSPGLCRDHLNFLLALYTSNVYNFFYLFLLPYPSTTTILSILIFALRICRSL